MKKLLVITFLFSIAFIYSCKYDKEQTLYAPKCDTLQVSYQETILPILEKNCYSCHSHQTHTQHNTEDLEGYENTKIYADNLELIKSITPVVGGRVFMPRGSERLSDCDIAKVRNWIKQGIAHN